MKKAISQIGVQEHIDQRRSMNEIPTTKLHLLPMQLQTKPQNTKFGISNSNKIYTQATDSMYPTLRTQQTKNHISSDRLLYDLDASLIYVHKEKVEPFEELQQDKINQLMKDTQNKTPQIADKLIHFFTLASKCDEKQSGLINQVIKVMDGVLILFDEKLNEINKLTNTIKIQREQIQSNAKLIEEQAQYFKNREKELLSNKNNHKIFQRSNELVLLNVQLEKKNEYLNDKIAELMYQNKDSLTTQLQLKLETMTKTLQQQQYKYYDLNSNNLLLQQQISSYKQGDLKYQMQLKNLEDKLKNQDELLKNKNYEILNIQDSLDHYREIAQMAKEDYSSLQYNIHDERKQMQRTYDKIRMLQNRIDEMTVKRSKQIDGPLDNRIDGDQIQLQAITKILDEDHIFQKYIMSSFQKNIQDYDSKIIDAYQDVKRLAIGVDNEAELQTLRYNYPPFTQFLEKRILETESIYLPQRPLENTFMGTLRAIMDGMYIEVQKDKPISFQAYVVSWLSTFAIENHRIVKIAPETKRVKIEQILHTFYLDLQVPRLNKVWEVLQFRHFLNDIYSLEELYFYLYSRYQVKRGPWMESFDAFYGVVNYMQLSHAEIIVKKYLSNFDKINTTLVLRALQERLIEGKRDRKLVHTGFVLQILLEIFRIDRNNRYKVLSFAFPVQPITFKSFHKFLKGNYAKCTEGEVADLWREVFMISNGIPNLNAFFVSAQHLFIKSMILPEVFPQPLLDQTKKLAFDELNFTTMKIQEEFKELTNNDFEAVKALVTAKYQEEYLDNSIKILNKQALLKNPPYYYLSQLITILLDQRFMILKNQGIQMDGTNKDGFEVEYFTDFIKKILCDINGNLDKQESKINDQNIRISRFQKYAQKKIKKIYVIISSVLQARIKQ